MITLHIPEDHVARRIAADVALIHHGFASARIGLIRRGKDPFKGQLALPGGRQNPNDEDALAAAIRELREEVGITAARERFEAFTFLDASGRDPRESVPHVSAVFLLEVTDEEVAAAIPGDDAAALEWPELELVDETETAFDHGTVIQRLRKKYEKYY